MLLRKARPIRRSPPRSPARWRRMPGATRIGTSRVSCAPPTSQPTGPQRKPPPCGASLTALRAETETTRPYLAPRPGCPTDTKAASAGVPYTPPGPPFGPWPPETDETSRHLPHRYLLTSVNRRVAEEGVVGVISALITYVYRGPGEPSA